MWQCPKCGRQCVGERCNFCGIENLSGKVRNVVGSNSLNGEEYYMVSEKFFEKKNANKLSLIGFILSIVMIVACVVILGVCIFLICYDGLDMLFISGVWSIVVCACSIVAGLLCLFGLKKEKGQTGTTNKLGTAGLIISLVVCLWAAVLIALSFGYCYGFWRGVYY